MAKIIKKTFRVLLVITAVLILLPAVLFMLLQAPRIQTYTVNMITKALSQKTGAKIMMGGVNYTMFHKIVLEDVLFEDLRGDTLLTVLRIDLRIRQIKPSEQLYRFGRVDLRRPDFRLIQDTSGVMNLTQYLNMLEGDNERDTTKSINLSFPDIDIHDGAFSLINRGDTAGIRHGTVNYKDMRVSGINGKLRDLRIIPDSVSMVLRGLTFHEAGGFAGRSLDVNVAIGPEGLFFREFELLTDSSAISAEKILLMPRGSRSWGDFINKVRMDLHFNNSVIDASDLAYFVRPLEGISEQLIFSGRVTGTVAEMKGRNIKIDYGAYTRLSFDIDISGLPSLNESYLYIDFKDMRTSAADAEGLTIPGKKPLKLPAIAHDLGLISYKGSFTGFTTDFVSFGKLTTERGTFSTDLSLRPDGRNTFSFKGFLKTSDVDLGYVTRNNKMFGSLWMHADIEGSMQSFKHLSANINGIIDSVDVNNYRYRNVSVAGKYADRIWDGTVAVKDRNISMDIMGRFDLEKSMPEFDFTLNLANADLHKLNLINGDTIFRATALMTASFKGNRADNLEGDLRLINSTLQNSRGTLSIYDFFVTSGMSGGAPLLTLRSDFADAEVRGSYSFDAIGTTVREMLALMFPSKFKAPAPGKNNGKNEAIFTLNTRIKKIDKLNEFLGTGLTISDGSLLTGAFSSGQSEMKAELNSEAITFAGMELSNMHLTGSVAGARMAVDLMADTLLLPDKSVLGNFNVNATSSIDTIGLGIRWDNKDGGKTNGEIKARGYYSLNEINRSVLTVGILPSGFTIRSASWSVSPARIVIDSTTVLFDNILVSSRTNYIRLDGKLSSFPDDRLTMSFEGLNLSYLNNLIGKQPEKKADAVEITFGGMMKGSVTLSDAFNDLLFESNVSISDFRLNNNDYGLVTVSSDWDPRKKVAAINVFNDFAGRKFFDISGTYAPSTKIADITVSTYDMPLDILNPFVKMFASDLRGVGSGRVRLLGKLKQFTLTGSVMARDASLKIDFLQTRYSFTDSIRFTPQGISFRNIKIYDEKQNQGTINGMLSHKSFKEMGINFDINMDRMLVMNTKPKDTDSFYGTAYASGYAGIRGDEKKLSFNISARTAANTEFFIPLNSSASVSDYPYIVFIDPVREKEVYKEAGDLFVSQKKRSNIELNFDLEITPEAEVQLIMDAATGGIIRGKGEGKLNISMSSFGDVKMVGDFIIRDGDYLFTLGNILNKRFTVENGGTISWNGPIEEADLNIRAIYRTKASLSDIYNKLEFPELQERLPVECILNLSGKLLNPLIKFDIILPTADERTSEYLRMAIDTEEKLSRQFLYLLVMNSFYTDPALYSGSGSGSGSQVSLTTGPGAEILGFTTTTEMLSNQLSNWLSQISNDFDVGFNYRPGNEITDQEVEVALSTQLLNDKVTLNGNVDVGGNQFNTNTSAITGEFTIEVRLTDKLRFKVFNRSNNNLYYQVHPYTQGVGVFYRRDFDTFRNLFIRPDERRKKKTLQAEETEGK
ncbi:MAG: translocation/assembly module TamB domain-containing protein [Bacteroidales bacterium]